MKYIIDIDGTICTQTQNNGYQNAEPHIDRIAYFNNLYDKGHEIHYWTARGMNSGMDWKNLTIEQFGEWDVKYHSLKFGKPSYDIWIDDKAMNAEEFFDDISNRT